MLKELAFSDLLLYAIYFLSVVNAVNGVLEKMFLCRRHMQLRVSDPPGKRFPVASLGQVSLAKEIFNFIGFFLIKEMI